MRERREGRGIGDGPLARTIQLLSIALSALVFNACGVLSPMYSRTTSVVPTLGGPNGEVTSTNVAGVVQTSSSTAPPVSSQIDACLDRLYRWVERIEELPAGFLENQRAALGRIAMNLAEAPDRCTDRALQVAFANQYGGYYGGLGGGYGSGVFGGRFNKEEKQR